MREYNLRKGLLIKGWKPQVAFILIIDR